MRGDYKKYRHFQLCCSCPSGLERDHGHYCPGLGLSALFETFPKTLRLFKQSRRNLPIVDAALEKYWKTEMKADAPRLGYRLLGPAAPDAHEEKVPSPEVLLGVWPNGSHGSCLDGRPVARRAVSSEVRQDAHPGVDALLGEVQVPLGGVVAGHQGVCLGISLVVHSDHGAGEGVLSLVLCCLVVSCPYPFALKKNSQYSFKFYISLMTL